MLKEDAERITARLMQDPGQQQEWLRQNRMIHGALIGVAVLLVQPFLTASSLDVPATISVIAFAVAIPLLAALVMLNEQEAFRRRASGSSVVDITKALALVCTFVGVVAAFWHIQWIAGVAIMASALVGVAVHSAGFSRLELGGDGPGVGS